ncbi:zinc ribbon domain-containing protein [Vibrio sp. AND4]|uniref:zinc ribbon domain-containing protein n=1 Tax=Vibrio sp. AND4 TaxID=314289 RepID=UPI00015F22F7|nr:zinc ribbon domain-containing protein [Vibrio sp. AND4]EDP58597.1 GTP-binding protein EngA [Vibrio sp. AND4]
MQPNICPTCDIELEWEGKYSCNRCESVYQKVGFCPDCDVALEKLRACGAENYFCSDCNELKSKSRVRFEFQKIS